MSATDYLRLGEQKIFKELKAGLPKNLSKAENLIAVYDGVLFAWDLQNNCILCLNIKAARGREGDNVVHQIKHRDAPVREQRYIAGEAKWITLHMTREAAMAERLRRLTRNQIPSGSVGLTAADEDNWPDDYQPSLLTTFASVTIYRIERVTGFYSSNSMPYREVRKPCGPQDVSDLYIFKQMTGIFQKVKLNRYSSKGNRKLLYKYINADLELIADDQEICVKAKKSFNNKYCMRMFVNGFHHRLSVCNRTEEKMVRSFDHRINKMRIVAFNHFYIDNNNFKSIYFTGASKRLRELQNHGGKFRKAVLEYR
nr:unnamed protein product [Callosobruchus chinensis]